MEKQDSKVELDAEGSRWGRLLSTSYDEIYVFDAQTLKFVQVSHGALDNLGYSIEEMKQLTAVNIKPELNEKEFKDLIQPLLNHETNMSVFRTVHQRKNGSRYPVEVRLQYAAHETPPVFIAIILDISDQLRSQENEIRLKQAQEIAKIGSWRLDFQSNELEWSEEMYRILEIDPQETSPSVDIFVEAVHPEDKQKLMEAYEVSLLNNKPSEILHRLIMPDGRLKYVNERCLSRFGTDGKPVVSMGTVQDVTDRVLAEQAIAETEQRIDILTQISPVGIFRTDAQGHCFYVNNRWMEMAGITSDEAMGQGWSEAIHIGDRERVFSEWYQAAQSNANFRTECRFQRPDGKVFWVISQATPERDEEGNIVAYFGTVTDITMQKRIEEALKIVAAGVSPGTGKVFLQNLTISLNKLFNAKLTFIAEIDKNNPDLLNTLAMCEDNLLSDNSVFNLPNTPCADVIEQGTVCYADDVRGRFPGNQLMEDLGIKSYIGVPLLDVHANKSGVIAVLDVKPMDDGELQQLKPILDLFSARASVEIERIKAQKMIQNQREELERLVKERTIELRTTNSELESFSYSVSHDLRSPLRAINGFTQALYEDYNDSFDETGKEYLHRVRQASNRMGKLIDDLLNLSRVSRGEFKKTQVDLSELVQDICENMWSNDSDHQYEIKIKPGVKGEADEALVKIVLDNLLNNAWKYTRKNTHPKIEFGTTTYQEQSTYYVADNGTGFDMRYVDKIFDVFQRLHSSEEYEGTGVGLATVQRIIHRHGGEIWVESEVGKGTTFYFTL